MPLPYRGVNFKSSPEGEFHIVSYTIGVLIIFGTFAFIGLAALRSVGRLWVVMTSAGRKGDHRVLIIGAGDAGPLLLRDIETQPQLGYNVVGFLDDKYHKHNLMVRSARILGSIDSVAEVVERLEVDELLVAILSMEADRRREVLELCTKAGIPMRIIAGFTNGSGSPGLADLRPVEIDDLLGRAPNEIDVDLIAETLTGKVVAVTRGSLRCRRHRGALW